MTSPATIDAAAATSAPTPTPAARPYGLDWVPEGGVWSDCKDEIERSYTVVPTAICGTCCVFGIVYCFFGYRCIKAVMFLTGLMFGSVVIFLLCHKERVLDTELTLEASAGIGLAIGLLCGLVTMLVRTVGLFTTGLLLGLLLAATTLVAIEPYYRPPTAWVPLGALVGSGMLFAVLTLQWPKPFVVLSTSAFGAAVVTAAVDYFVEMFALVRYASDRLRSPNSASATFCWYSWAVLSVWPTLGLLGILVQWKVTAERPNHAEVIIRHRQKRVQMMRIRQQKQQQHVGKRQRVPPEGIYRRKPCPVRRFTGDVLPPSYIQSLRERQHEASMSSLSGAAAGPHTTVDVEYDCGSMVPLTAPMSSSAVRA
ncbi:transmembrane protein 198-like [Petromyzon marinus]|uniref:Transmembrane protein 198 n=2 Tax=Petromyzon marinus TaxID=7757 RepID=A0AAJ7WML2_PETMA|nr:transmembrane protein 198-like [Petromyzon marinus]